MRPSENAGDAANVSSSLLLETNSNFGPALKTVAVPPSLDKRYTFPLANAGEARWRVRPRKPNFWLYISLPDLASRQITESPFWWHKYTYPSLTSGAGTSGVNP